MNVCSNELCFLTTDVTLKPDLLRLEAFSVYAYQAPH